MNLRQNVRRPLPSLSTVVLPPNRRIVDVHGEEMNAVVSWLVLGCVTLSMGGGACYAVKVMIERTVGVGVEGIVGLAGVASIAIAVRSFRKAAECWRKLYATPEERRAERLVSVLKPTSSSAHHFSEWLH